MDWLTEQRFNELKGQVERMNALKPGWKDEFDPEFYVAVRKVLMDYQTISAIKPETAKQANEQNDIVTYLIMALYTSIERVIKRQRIEQ